MNRPLDGKYRLMSRAELSARLLSDRCTLGEAADIGVLAADQSDNDLLHQAWTRIDMLEFAQDHGADSDEE